MKIYDLLIKNKNNKNFSLSKLFYNFILPKLFIPEELYFACTGCGKCCRYEPGFVFLTQKDIANITNFLKISKEDFIKNYTKKYNDLYSLVEKSNYDCVFWGKEVLGGKGGCRIYDVRPVQCKNYPFWISVFTSKKSFVETKKFCPGFNEAGKKYNKDEIINNILLDFEQRFSWYEKILKF